MFLNRPLLCLYFLLSVVAAAVNLTEVLLLIPQCALPCLIEHRDIATDPTASCTNEPLQASVSRCVQASCTPLDQANVVRANAKLCVGVPINNRRRVDGSIAAFVCAPLALIAIALRLYSRYSFANEFGVDDCLMCVNAVLLVVILVLAHYNANTNGMGLHLWTINVERFEGLLKILWVTEILYTATVTVIKTSILVFYLRIFPGRYTRAAAYTALALNISAGVAIILATIFQCTPVSGAWHYFIPRHCVNLNSLIFASGYIGIALDVLILLIPIPAVLVLRMELKNKILVMCMFSVGIFAFIISIVRLKFLVSFGNSTDPTWDNLIPSIWSLAEITVATICACMPAVRALLARKFPNVFDILSHITQPSHPQAFKHTPFPAGSEHRAISTPSSERLDIMYSKGSVATQEEISLDTIGAQSNGKDTTLWLNSRGDHLRNNFGDKRKSQNSACASIHDNSDISILAIEGPGVPNKETVIEDAELGVARKQEGLSRGFRLSRNGGNGPFNHE